MKLYKIYQDINSGYDTYDSAIVAAESEDEAKQWQPNGKTLTEHIRETIEIFGDDDEWWVYRGWCKPEHVGVICIGDALPNVDAGVILASFNAG